MEFPDLCEEEKKWALRVDSEDEEALSLRDLPSAELSAEWESTLRDSKLESPEDFDFDCDFGGSGYTCPADDLFHGGRLLPLTLHRCTSESNAVKSLHSKSNSCGEKSFMLNEKLQSWRTDSLDSQSSYWTSSSSNNSQASHRSLNFSASDKSFWPVNSTGKSKSKANRASGKASKPSAPSSTKTSLKWQQIFSLGLIKTPPMKLEDMRHRQREKPILKPSVSCCDDEGSAVGLKESRGMNFQQKSKSVKGNMSVEETPRAKGWSKLAPLTSLNGCKACTNSAVINCSTTKKRVDGGLAQSGKTPTKKLPLYADQNSPNSARVSSKLAASKHTRGGLAHGDHAILGGTHKSFKVDSSRLSFRIPLYSEFDLI